MLEIKNLTKSFGGLTAVSDLSFDLEKGELLGLIGPNGAGKTTLFNLISGVLKPTSGGVFFEGRSITGWPPHRLTATGIVRTFQNLRLMKGMSLFDNMKPAFHLKLHYNYFSALLEGRTFRSQERWMEDRIMDGLELFQMASYRNVPVDDLAYGLQKRAELVRALLFEPRILLLDEPAAGLNPSETDELMQVIRSIHKERRLSIIVVEHNMKVIMGVSQRVVVMEQGKLIAQGSPYAIRNDESVVKAYLGERAWKKQARRLDEMGASDA